MEDTSKLNELSKLNINDMAEIDANVASESLIECMKQYHIDINDKTNKSIIDKVNTLS